jgi:hypothetical protein
VSAPFKVGDEVFLIRSYGRKREPEKLTITKVGRKYADVGRDGRFDMKTMHGDGGVYYTAEGLAMREEARAARDYLLASGKLDTWHTWRMRDHEIIAIAGFVRLVEANPRAATALGRALAEVSKGQIHMWGLDTSDMGGVLFTVRVKP